MSNLQDPSAILNKARHRWRLAYTCIHSLRIFLALLTNKNTIKAPKKRWQVAFATICSYRAITLLHNEVVAKRNNHNNPPFVAIHVEQELFFSNVNMTCITKLVKDKDHDTLLQLGGIDGLVISLQTDQRKGINGSPQDVSRRQKDFGCNIYHHKLTTESFFHYVLITMKDPILIILLVCATLTVGFNIKENGLKHGWYDGGSILIAVLVVVIVCSMSHFWPYRKINKLLQTSRKNHVEVVRNGQNQHVLASDIVVGDVVCLRSGNQVPADGLLLSSYSSLLVDQSSLEEDDFRRVEVSKVLNPFLFSGTKVEYGNGQMLVTSVGENTRWGEMMSLLGHQPHKWRSLESRLMALTRMMGLVGSAVAILTLIVLLLRYFSGYMKSNAGSMMFIAGKTGFDSAWPEVVGILVSTMAVATSAIPEGLPLAVAITVSYTMNIMIKNQALFRQFSNCVKLASTSVICIETNMVLKHMKQKNIKLWLGGEFMASQLIATNVRDLLCQGISLSTTQLSGEFSQNSVEEAITCWATTELGMDVQESREGLSVLHVETLIEEMKHNKVVVRNNHDCKIHVHLNGKAEGVVSECSHYYGVEGTLEAIDNKTRRRMEERVQVMRQEGFKCIALAHKVLQNENYDIVEESYQWLEDETLILLALICLKDPIQPTAPTPKAVLDCKHAGVNIKLITSEDVLTATAIASECGILHHNEEFEKGGVVEASEFRNYTETERIEKVDQICVIAKATSSDKLLLVQCLKQKGHVVTVTGRNNGDTPALKEADVAIHMGFQGNSIAIESSDIIVLNESFVSLFSVLQICRGIYDNIKVSIQFLLAANLASLVTDFVSTVSADHPPTIDILAGVSVKDIPYAVLQILWLKLIIGTLSIIALVVEQNTKEFMQEKPIRPEQPLLSMKICKNILIHASYEIAILLTFQFKGEKLLQIDADVKDTMVFNLLVLFQVFAVLIARKPDGNIFRGAKRRKLFLGIIFSIVVLQAMILEIMAKVTRSGTLNLWQWGASIGIAFTSCPIHYLASKFIHV